MYVTHANAMHLWVEESHHLGLQCPTINDLTLEVYVDHSVVPSPTPHHVTSAISFGGKHQGPKCGQSLKRVCSTSVLGHQSPSPSIKKPAGK
jgi:hypothetical protein